MKVPQKEKGSAVRENTERKDLPANSAVKHVEVKHAQQRRSVRGVRRKSLHAPISSIRNILKHPGLNELKKNLLSSEYP